MSSKYGFSDDETPAADPNVQVTLGEPKAADVPLRSALKSNSTYSIPRSYPQTSFKGSSYPIADDYGYSGYVDNNDDVDEESDSTSKAGKSTFKMILPFIAAAGVGALVFFVLRPTEKTKGSDGNPLEKGSEEWNKKSRNAMIGAVVAAAIAGGGSFFVLRRPSGLTGAERLLSDY